MKKIAILFLILFTAQIKAQTCAAGGCSIVDTNSTGKYPTSTFSTNNSSWATVSAYMNAGNYTLFNVTNGDTYEWTYCSDFGGSMGWDAELTLFNNATGTLLCYNDNCGRTNCSTSPYLRWTATFTGTVKLLTTVSGCQVNTGSPYSKLVWRDTSAVQILGVDVYSGNSTINWAQVKAAGYTFAWAKATEGVGYTDGQYLNYAVNGVNAGLKMGAYHFARPDLNPSNAGAISEANYFLSIAQPYITACQLPPALDLEGSYLETDFTSQQLTDWVQNWMTTVETATGFKPVLYIGSSTCSYVKSTLNVYPLWRDDLSGTPTTAPANIGVWNTWAINQYSWTGTVPGIAGSQTDVDVFNGNTNDFNAFMECITTNIKQNSPADVFAMYPNPASRQVTIQTNEIEIQSVYLYDINGKLLFSKNANNTSLVIDVSAISEGVYTLAIKTANGISNKKLVIVK